MPSMPWNQVPTSHVFFCLNVENTARNTFMNVIAISLTDVPSIPKPYLRKTDSSIARFLIYGEYLLSMKRNTYQGNM